MNGFKVRWDGDGGYRQFLIIAVPLILSTGAWSIQYFVDRMFLSWYSPEAIAAAVPAGLLSYAIMSLFIGTTSYVSTFVAQYFGAEMYHRIGPSLWQGIYISAIGGVILILFIPLATPIFNIVGHDPLVMHYEIEYFQVLCLGGFPHIAGSAISGFFSGRGKAWPIMWVNCLATAINLILDYALIFGNWGFPEMGIKGAGIATVLGGVVAFVILVISASIGGRNKVFHTLSGWRLDKDLFIRLVRFGFPSGIQFFLDMVGFSLFILLIGRLGTVGLAASNIAFNINTLAFMPMIGSGIAISVLVGQYLGRNMPDLAVKSTYSGFHLTFIYMVIIAIAYWVFPELFVAPFAARADGNYKEIYHLSVILLRFVAIYSIFDAMNIVFASAIKGAGDTRFVMVMLMVLSGLIMVIPTYLAVAVMDFGIMSCWLIATVYIISLGLAFYFRFRGGKWKHMRVVETA